MTNIDVLIIGGGIVGLSAAISAKRKDATLRVALVERDVFSAGASTKNAGFACFGSPSEILDDLTRIPEEEVFETIEKRIRGLENLRTMVGEEELGFENTGGFELFREGDEQLFEQCEAKLEYLNKRMFPFTGTQKVYRKIDVNSQNWRFRGVRHAIANDLEGLIDTGEMISRLWDLASDSGVRILHGLNIDALESTTDGVICFTEGAAFKIGKVIVCTNGLAAQILPHLPVVPARNQVLVTSEISGLSFNGAFHLDRGYVYFRHIGNRVLIGGFRNLDKQNEETWEFGLTPIIQEKLEETLREVVLPENDFTIDYRWSGIMGLGASKKPIVEEISPNLYAAVRMGGMGVAIGSLIGKEVVDLAIGNL